MVVVVSCDNCGSDVEKHQYELESTEHSFCSKDCHNEFQSTTISKECPICNKSFETKEYDERKYCSKSCYGTSKESKELVECSSCGDEVLYHKYRIREQDSFYCSKDCRSESLSENWEGEDNPNYTDGRYNQFGSNWIEKRDKARERASGYCQGCGKSKKLNGRKLDVHHVIPRSFFIESEEHQIEDANQMENLVALCQSCHAKEEAVCRDVLNNILL